MSTSATARATHRLTDQVEAKLGNGKAPAQRQPPSVEFTRVADATPPRLSRLLAPGAALVVLSPLGLSWSAAWAGVRPERQGIWANRGAPAGTRRLDLR